MKVIIGYGKNSKTVPSGQVHVTYPKADKEWADVRYLHLYGLDSPRLQMLFPRQYDVGVDNNNYTPISFAEVEVKIQDQIAKSLSHDAGSLK